MPRTKEQYEKIRSEKKRAIMETALQLFAEQGFAGTSIETIAQHAKISKGLLYNYFESKDDLLHQIILTGVEIVTKAGVFKPGMTREDFIRCVKHLLDMVEEHRNFLSLYSALGTQPGIAQKVTPTVENSAEITALLEFFGAHSGNDAAIKEVLLFSSLIKGYYILSLFGVVQKVMSLNLLKETILEFAIERWGTVETEHVPSVTCFFLH
ncbi:MAG: TetR/AcrR family transcriptional regulator [Tannerella sp.]|jgi:AcrR family transcriptional regulator|nr:TetR/AcrR family transcriptional regulator [Tannerella sp.]